MINIYLKEFELSAEENRREKEHLAGEMLLREGLKKEYGIVYGEDIPLPVVKGEKGKPQLKEYPHIYHNISHTDGLAVCALGDEPVGIDTELIRPFSEKIIRKVMSPQEQELFEKLKGDERTAYFFKIWTLKESYVKAKGCGITIPLTDFSFYLEDGTVTCSVPGVHMVLRCLREKYMLSLCTYKETKICWNRQESI
ncbi:4'-phosphopantetheinyl transferase superfamily protein [Clostridium boliviensis]|uniref:4'-phosphopantetheinyl transferase superfamily protein n=1 Tax=Clostridium boliviensis TaxID=318465 RepID=A0ABU4GSC2_9CLOT|nr:4'-phosphopantetheinyl transferase superfamily protein [Clostridium boliviensis]MDW2799092.1 4'-phosphopantetheinyl transferase superfamily protein [Clostridium boliviensis]